jgi:hypothetical protein
MPGESGFTCGDYARVLVSHLYARRRVQRHPAFPTPSFRGQWLLHDSGVSRREIAMAHLELSWLFEIRIHLGQGRRDCERRIACVNATVTSFVYTPPTISLACRGLRSSGRRVMLRFKILVSAVPLLIAVVLARGGLLPGPHPCVPVGEASVRIASVPRHADLHVSFTDDPLAATVRVQIAASAEGADFVVIDDADTFEAGACEANTATRLVAISATPSGDAPVIYLSQDGPADYRIFVRSKAFTARDAAALIVGASGGHRRLVAASL